MEQQPLIKRGRGRPKGSKNKKKAGDIKPPVVSTPDVQLPKKRGRPSKADLEARAKFLGTTQTAPIGQTDNKPEKANAKETIPVTPTRQPKPTKLEEVKQVLPPYEGMPAVITQRPYEKGDEVERIATGERGSIEFQRPNSKFAYIHWGGGYYNYMHVDVIKYIPPKPTKRKQK